MILRVTAAAFAVLCLYATKRIAEDVANFGEGISWRHIVWWGCGLVASALWPICIVEAFWK